MPLPAPKFLMTTDPDGLESDTVFILHTKHPRFLTRIAHIPTLKPEWADAVVIGDWQFEVVQWIDPAPADARPLLKEAADFAAEKLL